MVFSPTHSLVIPEGWHCPNFLAIMLFSEISVLQLFLLSIRFGCLMISSLVSFFCKQTITYNGFSGIRTWDSSNDKLPHQKHLGYRYCITLINAITFQADQSAEVACNVTGGRPMPKIFFEIGGQNSSITIFEGSLVRLVFTGPFKHGIFLQKYNSRDCIKF